MMVSSEAGSLHRMEQCFCKGGDWFTQQAEAMAYVSYFGLMQLVCKVVSQRSSC